MNVVENNYMLHIVPSQLPSNAYHEAITKLATPPPNWSLKADEELVRFLVDNCKNVAQSIGGASKYIEQVTVSSVSCFLNSEIVFVDSAFKIYSKIHFSTLPFVSEMLGNETFSHFLYIRQK